MSIVLDGQTELSIEAVKRVLWDREAIVLSPSALDRLDESFRTFSAIAQTQPVYGVNTGFGPMVTHAIDPDQWSELQTNLIVGHAMGMGNALSIHHCRAIVFARLVTLMRGYSAIDRRIPVMLGQMLNANVVPNIPEHGGVGASGDLVQLAHLGRCLLGHGQMWYQDSWRPSSDVLTALELTPLVPELRDGLAIINGTAAMTGMALDLVLKSRRLIHWAMLQSCLLQEIVANSREPFSEGLNGVKLHRGQRLVAQTMRDILADSNALRAPSPNVTVRSVARPLQEHYSIRCVPQIMGPILDTCDQAQETILAELNSVSDNPIFDAKTGIVLHGGNFHGDYVAFELDKLKAAIVKLSLLSERQLNFLLNDELNKILPPFVNLGVPGLNMGLQGAQFTATSTASENQSLAYPNSLHSIPSNKDNQDIVSMGMNCAFLTSRVIENTCQISAISVIALLQSVDFLGIQSQLSTMTGRLYTDFRQIVPRFESDTLTSEHLSQVQAYLMSTDAP